MFLFLTAHDGTGGESVYGGKFQVGIVVVDVCSGCAFHWSNGRGVIARWMELPMRKT